VAAIAGDAAVGPAAVGCRAVARRPARRQKEIPELKSRRAGNRLSALGRKQALSSATPVKHRFENHNLTTERASQLIDLTDDVLAVVERAEIENGMVLVYSPHTTCAIVINEHETGFLDDFCEFLAELAPPEGRYYRHDDLEIRTQGIEEDTADFPNGHSHLQTGLLSSASQTIPIVDGKLMLGTWQRIFFCELDRSRSRKVFIQVIGE
jgi:secondary thiamine-phosphate synthase enzyme